MSKIVGNQLRNAREARGISLNEASESLFIRTTYLQALENGRGEIIPSPVQTRGFLRLYAEYLGLDSTEILRQWDEPNTAQKPAEVSPAASRPAADLGPAVRLPPFPAADPQMPTHGNMPPQTPPQNAVPLPQPPPSPQPVYTPDPGAQVQPAAPQKPDQPQKAAGKPAQKPTEKRKGLFGKNKKAEQDQPPVAQADPIRTIFREIGTELQQRRQALGLSIEDCESQTVIRGYYIQLMESGDLDQLPSFIQARGMLNNYAAFLNLDTDAIMLKFADALQLLSQEKARKALSESSKNKEKPRKPTKKANKLQQFLTPDLFVGVFVIIAMSAVILYCVQTIAVYRRNLALTPTADFSQLYASQAELETPTPVLQPTATATINPFSLVQSTAAEETGENDAGVLSNAPVQLYISANQRTYLRVVADGKEVFSGRTLPNNTYPFDAQNRIEVTTGNADALSFTYNQQNLGKLGSLGEVLRLQFTGETVITATPQFSPTPTATYQPTYTPMPETPMATLTSTPYIP